MKIRLAPVLTIGIAVVLIGSLAYAADRRKQTKLMGYAPDPAHEEEALRAELLEAVEGNEMKSFDVADVEKLISNRTDTNPNQSKPSKLTSILPKVGTVVEK